MRANLGSIQGRRLPVTLLTWLRSAGEGSTMTNRQFPMKASTLSLITVAMVAILCALYMMSQFLRNSVGVIAPDLAKEIQLSAAELGLLSSVFFLMFGLAQIPLGIALDRFGPKPCLLVSVVVAVA